MLENEALLPIFGETWVHCWVTLLLPVHTCALGKNKEKGKNGLLLGLISSERTTSQSSQVISSWGRAFCCSSSECQKHKALRGYFIFVLSLVFCLFFNGAGIQCLDAGKCPLPIWNLFGVNPQNSHWCAVFTFRLKIELTMQKHKLCSWRRR